VIAAIDRTVIDQRVLFFSLIAEPGRSALLSSKAHLDLMIGTDRDIGFDAIPSENQIQNVLQRDSLRT